MVGKLSSESGSDEFQTWEDRCEFYYRDPSSISNEFHGPFDESTVQHWYREGFFHSNIQFRLGNCSGYTTLGSLRELNGIMCPFASAKDPRDEEIRCLGEQLKEAKLRLNEMGERNETMERRIEWLEASCSWMDDDIERNRRDAEGMRTMIDRLAMKPDAPKKETEVETKKPLEKAVLSTSYAQVVRVVPEQQSVQKKMIVEKDRYPRFIKEILGEEVTEEKKAQNWEITRLIELMKKKNDEVHDAMHSLFETRPKCLPCGATIESSNNFIGHLTSKKHMKVMYETGVSKKAVNFFTQEFRKLA